MGERKVLNKYYPPDFDPAKIPRRRMPKDRQYTVRLMSPFNMRCTTCGEYIYKGKKFNAIKETVLNEEYLGLRIFRFYIRCTRCTAEISFKTDPKNTDYVCENGATRNFENWREDTKGDEDAIAAAALEKEQNPMLALENRTRESRQEMDILDALEEIKDANARLSKVDVNTLLEKTQQDAVQEEQVRSIYYEAHDEAMARAVFGGERESKRIKRLDDEEGAAEASAEGTKEGSGGLVDPLGEHKPVKVPTEKPAWEKSVGSLRTGLSGLVRAKPKAPAKEPVAPPAPATVVTAARAAAPAFLSLVGTYSDSDADD